MKSLAQIEPRVPISSLPFTITNSGSYYLVSNLTLVSVSSQNGITVLTNNVTIDLKGFSLTGSGVTGSGIALPNVQTNLVVHDGTIESWGGKGIDAEQGVNCSFFHLSISDAGDDGLNAGLSSSVVQCNAANALTGISTSDSSVVQSCVTTFNASLGISAGVGATISDCSGLYNGAGIFAGTGSIISRCVARSNGDDGFRVDQGTIVDCTAQANARRGFFVDSGSTISHCTARVNTQDGILAGTSCQVLQNTCELNGYTTGTGAGIRASGTQNRIDGNHVVNNDYGIQVQATNNIIIRNSAESNGTNYLFTGAQIFGPTNNLVGAGGVITNQSPWANFSF